MWWSNMQALWRTYSNKTAVVILLSAVMLLSDEDEVLSDTLASVSSTDVSKSMAPVWIPLREGWMSEGMRGGKLQLAAGADRWEKGCVSGNENGRSKEGNRWGGAGGLSVVCSPSKVSFHSTVNWNDLKIMRSEEGEICKKIQHTFHWFAGELDERPCRRWLWFGNSELSSKTRQEHTQTCQNMSPSFMIDCTGQRKKYPICPHKESLVI